MMQGAIFDMDGVLVDNLEVHVQAFQELGREQGQPLSRDRISAVFGRKNRDMLGILLGRELSDEQVEVLSRRKEVIYRKLAADLPAMEVAGLRELLDSLRQHQIRIALATSGPPENVAFLFSRLRLGDYFDGVITSNEVTLGKPHPDVFLKAAASIGADPKDSVVFEDSRSGIRAAFAAGAKCVALATTHARDELEDLEPDLIRDDFRGLTVEELRSLWE